MISKSIDIQKYRRDYVDTLSKEERQAIRQDHLERMQQGADIWNTWAKQVLAAIEQTYPNATEEEKLVKCRQYQIDFSGVTFNKKADFSGFIFPIEINFTNATFGEAHFIGATFSKRACFYKVKFLGETRFHKANFFELADLEKVKFHKYTEFSEVTFHDMAVFQNSEFNHKVNFSNVVFHHKADFRQVIFSSPEVSFWEASFHKTLDFRNVKFNSGFVELLFLGAQFQQQSLFVDVKFDDATTAIPCDFRQTDFYLPPLVDDFPSDLSQFIKANKSIKRDKYFYKVCEAKFRALKQLAEKNNNHQKTLEFYGCELYCQRRASGGLRNPTNWANYLYGWFSGYGLSLLYPFILWLMVMCIAIGAQALNDGKTSFSFTTAGWERVGFYIAPSMPPFVGKPLYQKEVRHRLYENKVDKDLNGQLPTFNRVVRFFQGLVTFITIFLFGLALRNRFKIG